MGDITLYKHQKKALMFTEKFNRCAYYLDRHGWR